MNDLKGKNIIVTGASGGIGNSIIGKLKDLEKLIQILKDNSIKNIKLPVSAPFHCDLMNNATKIMTEELNKLSFKNGQNKLISNVTANEIKDPMN